MKAIAFAIMFAAASNISAADFKIMTAEVQKCQSIFALVMLLGFFICVIWENSK